VVVVVSGGAVVVVVSGGAVVVVSGGAVVVVSGGAVVFVVLGGAVVAVPLGVAAGDPPWLDVELPVVPVVPDPPPAAEVDVEPGLVVEGCVPPDAPVVD